MVATLFQHPDFMIIGAGKSGTTALAKYMGQHPEVFMSPIKEPDFFALEGQTPVDPKNDPERLYYYPQAIYNAKEYLQLFQDAEPGMKTGEASTMYLYKPGTPERIKKYKPDVKMIAIFRNPAERLYSRYLHLARVNELPDKNMENMFDQSSIWWRRHDLIYEGFFHQHLSRFYDLFPKEQLKVFLYEDIKNDVISVIKEIYRFIDVDDTFMPNTEIRYNQSGFVKNKFKEALIGNNSIIRRSVQAIAPALINKMRNNQYMQKKLNKMRKQNLHRPELDQELKQRIIDDIYKDDILKFQDLINRDLSKWLKV
ncbi:MAG: sulfotransferase domain-containing protein [Bacteroidales bacterium]|nr:sulfotransferase domain-containing protein [Bacteroidales bacterium]